MPVNRYRVYFVKRPKIYPHAFAARQSNTAPRQTLFRPGHIEQHIDDPAVSAAVGEPWYKIGIVVAIAFADVIFGGHRIAELRFECFLRLRAPPQPIEPSLVRTAPLSAPSATYNSFR